MNHVAFLIPTLDRIAGAERQLLLLGRGLASRGWRVTVIALAGEGREQAALLESSGIQFLSLQMRKGLVDLRGWFTLGAWLRSEKPDVLHAHLPHAAWMARWSRLFAPVRVVIDTVHTAGIGTHGRKLGYRASNWLTDCITVVSHGAAETWLATHMIPRDKTVVLSNGVNTENWKPDAITRAEFRKQLCLPNEFLWLAAGRMEPIKDFPTLLKALAGLPSSARLALVGSGSQLEMLQSLARTLRIASRVHFAGQVKDVLPWMQAADGLVLSSLWEGLPMSLLEAGACELPAVSTRVAGATEIVKEGESGFLCNIADVDALHAAMTRLMRLTATEREQMGLRARSHIQAQYSLSSILDRWEILYTQLLEQHISPARRGHSMSSKVRNAARGASVS